VKHVKW